MHRSSPLRWRLSPPRCSSSGDPDSNNPAGKRSPPITHRTAAGFTHKWSHGGSPTGSVGSPIVDAHVPDSGQPIWPRGSMMCLARFGEAQRCATPSSTPNPPIQRSRWQPAHSVTDSGEVLALPKPATPGGERSTSRTGGPIATSSPSHRFCRSRRRSVVVHRHRSIDLRPPCAKLPPTTSSAIRRALRH